MRAIPALLALAIVSADPLPTDLSHRELAEIPIGSHFRHDGELWVRLAPDPDREDDGRDARPVILAARLTGEADGLGVPRPLFARCWVRPAGVKVLRVREAWE